MPATASIISACNTSLADFYAPLTMPEELLKGHKANNAVACEAYGWSKYIDESEIAERLFVMYKELAM